MAHSERAKCPLDNVPSDNRRPVERLNCSSRSSTGTNDRTFYRSSPLPAEDFESRTAAALIHCWTEAERCTDGGDDDGDGDERQSDKVRSSAAAGSNIELQRDAFHTLYTHFQPRYSFYFLLSSAYVTSFRQS